jgi:hypothetical protein
MIIRSSKRNRHEDYFNPTSPFISGEKVSRCIVELERNGFSVNVPLLNQKCEKAEHDEQVELQSLRSDYRAYNFPSKNDEEIDAIWSSSKQLIELIHDWMGLEHSPIYKKGQVATWKGDVRLDGVALDYLGNRYSEHRVFLHRIRNLRTIRGCIKYLSKLPQFVGSDGLIHPTYGPMGDDDERSGTHTGRLGMKNPEGHQIPLELEKDPYGIRECFNVPQAILKSLETIRQWKLSSLPGSATNSLETNLYIEQLSLVESSILSIRYNVFGIKLGWEHPSGKAIADWTSRRI